jgi:pimeloyl-ACP methyl ester carboxylesterase
MAINTIVLVHGAFADGSCWAKVIPLLTKRGLRAIAVQNPLSSLADDVTAAHRVIGMQEGPVLLVGHSWGGAVITEAGNHPQVKGLVYIAAGARTADSRSRIGGKTMRSHRARPKSSRMARVLSP